MKYYNHTRMHAVKMSYPSNIVFLFPQDYNISEMSVLQMVPISFGRHARPETTASVPRPFTTLTTHKPHTLTNDQGSTHPLSSVGAHTLSALRKEVTIFKRRQHLLQALQVITECSTVQQNFRLTLTLQKNYI